MDTVNMFLYASREALLTAELTSGHLERPIPILHFLFPTKTVALKDIFLPHVVTLVTLLTSRRSSSNSFFTLSLFQDLMKNTSKMIKLYCYSSIPDSISQCFDPSMIEIAVPIERSLFDALFLHECRQRFASLGCSIGLGSRFNALIRDMAHYLTGSIDDLGRNIIIGFVDDDPIVRIAGFDLCIDPLLSCEESLGCVLYAFGDFKHCIEW